MRLIAMETGKFKMAKLAQEFGRFSWLCVFLVGMPHTAVFYKTRHVIECIITLFIATGSI